MTTFRSETKFASDSRLNEKLVDWHALLERLKPLEERYLLLEAELDSMSARAFVRYDGAKTVKERECNAELDAELIRFKRHLATTRAEYLDMKRQLELKVKAFEAEYLTMKVEAEAIRKIR